ncbi:MAG: hypothetical protein QOC70_1768 [Verrucomicrobiota bacterium]|jgi:hypothetical protein
MKTLYQLFFSLVLTSIVALPAPAKPLSYVGGTMVMQENDETGNTLSVDYTFDPHFALGLYAKRDIGGKEFYTIGPQLNTLIKRWNLPDGQGNIFSMTGVGTARRGSNSQPAAWVALLADYETRRVFFSYEPRLMYAGEIETSFWHRAHAGFAPYLANYEQLNTWLLLRVDHHPAKNDHFVVTPMVRFFYKTIWLEAGYSSNNHVMVNWTVQF